MSWIALLWSSAIKFVFYYPLFMSYLWMIGALIFQCIITGILFWIIYRRSDENPRVLYLLMAILRVNIFAIAFLQASVNDVIAQDEMRQVEE